MGSRKKKKTMEETLTSIDSVLASLDAYPVLEDAILEKIQGEMNKYLGQFFPTQLDFAKEILEHLVGTDVLIKIVSNFLTVALPEVEVSLKAVLLANMQNLGTNCIIDPFIYEKAVKEGILFDLKQIDLYDKLSVSPLDEKIGQYYYFGIDDCESSHDVLMSAIDPNNQTDTQKEEWSKKQDKDSDGNRPTQKEGTSYINRALTDSVGHYFGKRKRDFDCLLWYMKNKGVTRQVWGKRTSESEDIFYGDEKIQEWIDKKGDKKTVYYKIDENNLTFYTKSDSKVSKPSASGTLEALNEEQTYIFNKGKTLYQYNFGNPPITKLSRKKVYVQEKSPNSFNIFFYSTDDKKWINAGPRKLVNFESFEKIPLDGSVNLEVGDFICVDKSVYLITGDVKKETIKKKNKDGVESQEEKITSIKTDECIDITVSLEEDTTLYIDYDEIENDKRKGDIIKENTTTPTSTFNEWVTNNGKRQWVKCKIKGDEQETVQPTVCYYIDADKDGKYTPNVDKILIPPHDKNGFYVNINDAKAKKNKYTKDFGILTLEYSPRTGNVIQSDGKPMQQQTPYDNVLHVFFGNVKEIHTTERDGLERNWEESSNTNRMSQKIVKKINDMYDTHLKIWKRNQKEAKKELNVRKSISIQMKNSDFAEASVFYEALINGGETYKYNFINRLPVNYTYYDDINGLSATLSEVKIIIDKWKKLIYSTYDKEQKKETNKDENNDDNDFNPFNFEEFKNELFEKLKIEGTTENYYTITAFSDRIKQIMNQSESLFYLKSKNLEYPEAEKNYYLKRTLFEFNTDYVNSLQLFDSKVLAAQLITSLFGSLSMSAMIGATAAWKTELIHDIVKDMVEKEIAAEDFTVSDCFFTFSNDAYNGMLRATELRQAGLYSQHGEENGNNKIDPVKLLEGLNDINNCADQAGQTDVIEGAIMTAAGEVCKDVYKENNYLAINTHFGIQTNFIKALMTNLCTQLVMAMLSPKVYLLILINLEMFGLSTNFDLKSFIQRFQALIRSIVKSVVDKFMQYITQKIKEIIEDLVQKLIKKLAMEQVEMYARLIKQILMHLRMLTSCGDGMGWTQDLIGYADILNSSSESPQEPIDEC